LREKSNEEPNTSVTEVEWLALPLVPVNVIV
jgi:hypothetical protein